jgi:hypothetical protein
MSRPPGNSLESAQGGQVAAHGETLADGLQELSRRIAEEIDYNRAKGETSFRLGMHDGLRFAQDAVAELLRRHGYEAEVEGGEWDA